MNTIHTNKPPLSTIILTLNEEVNLPDCLKSLEKLHTQVFVVDSNSTDLTVEIAQKAGASVETHEFDSYAKQRNWAQENLPLETDWVLHLDADERLTPELVLEINQAVRNTTKEIHGFLLRKRTIFLGKWIKHGGHYPAYHLRLFRRDSGSCEDRLYDQHFIVTGKVLHLKHDYLDVLTSDLTTWTARHARWAELEAQELMTSNHGKERVQPRILGSPIERRRWLRESLYGRLPLFLRPCLYWFYRYFIRLGFMDGMEGMVFHSLQGFWYRFLVDAKIFEANLSKSKAKMTKRGYRND